MIWLAISAYAVVGLLFVVGLCRAASRANMAGLHLRRHAPEHLSVNLTEAETQAPAATERQAERGA